MVEVVRHIGESSGSSPDSCLVPWRTGAWCSQWLKEGAMHELGDHQKAHEIDIEACFGGLATVLADAVKRQVLENALVKAVSPEPQAGIGRPPRELFTVDEAAECLAISRTVVYSLVKAGELESVRIGKLRRVPASALGEFVSRLRGLES